MGQTTLGKNGYRGMGTQGPFNLTNILKHNLLEDDGVEDMHFYLVAFKSHYMQTLKKIEHKGMIEQIKKEMYERGEIDCEEDLKRLTKGDKPSSKNRGKNLEVKPDSKVIKTIESIDELEIF